MRGANRGGLLTGTPEVYFTDPGGILLQLQDNNIAVVTVILGALRYIDNRQKFVGFNEDNCEQAS